MIKKITLFAAVFMFSYFSFQAQEREITNRSTNYVPQKGDYIRDLNADNFYGTWLWEDGIKKFELDLSKEKYDFEELGFFMDVVMTKHYYYENDILISSHESSIGNSSDNLLLRVTFFDPVYNKHGNAILKIKPQDNNKVDWLLNNYEGIRVGEFNPAFSVPVKFTMERQ